MRYSDQVTDQVVYHLSPGLAIEGAPQDAKISWAAPAAFVTKAAPASGQITTVCQLSRVFAQAKAEEYQDLRGFYQKVAAAEPAATGPCRLANDEGQLIVAHPHRGLVLHLTQRLPVAALRVDHHRSWCGPSCIMTPDFGLSTARWPVPAAPKDDLMRASDSSRIVLFLLFLTSPVLVRAQFKQPTGEELKMTADPKAPGATAVYLDIEEAADDPLHLETYYARIKVLTEKGKDLATVEIPYWRDEYKVTDIQARTIHPDGTIVPLTGKPDDLLRSKQKTNAGGFQVNTMVFNLPSVEVGSILEYYYQVHVSEYRLISPYWEVQRSLFVHKAHYAFTSDKDFMPNNVGGGNLMVRRTDEHGNEINALVWWPVLPAGMEVKTDSAGRRILDVADIPAMPDEEWMPPVENFRYHVQFYYKNALTPADFWAGEIRLWSKEVDRFAEPSKPIHDAVDGLIVPGDSEIDKARKLYAAVQALDNTDFSRRRNEAELKQLKLKEARRAEDIWAQKSGSSEDIALLYLAMARAAGLDAFAMKVVDRSKGIFDITYLNARQLTDTIVVLNIRGADISLDPGEKMCPFQTLHWRHSNAGGFLEGGEGKTIKNSPSQIYSDNKFYRTGDINVDKQGAVDGILQFSMIGQEALSWRQFALTNDEAEVIRSFDRWLLTIAPQGVEMHIDRFHAIGQPDQKLLADVSVKGTLGTSTSKRLLLPAFFFQTRGGHPFVDQEKRMEPVDMQYASVVTDQIIYHLPQDMALEGAPQDAKISWPQHAVFVAKTVSAPGQVTVARSLARAFTFASQDEYQDLRGFFQKIAASDQQQLVLTASPAGKGN